MGDGRKRVAYDGLGNLWRLVGSMIGFGAVEPFFALRDQDVGLVKWGYAVGLAGFALAAMGLTLKACDRYVGPQANTRIWRAIGILSLAAALSVVGLFYVFGDSDPPALRVLAWLGAGMSATQILTLVVVFILVPDNKRFPEPG